MRRVRKIHNRIRRRRINQFLNEILIYMLYYFCPIIALIGGLFGTYKLVIYKSYGSEYGFWNITNAFCMAAIGLSITIVLTILVARLVSKAVDHLCDGRVS